MFGLLTLLGFDYRPALADLPDAKLWRTDPAADYGPLDRAARGSIDLDKVPRTGRTSAVVALRSTPARSPPTT